MKRKFLLSEAEAMGRLVRAILQDVSVAYIRARFLERQLDSQAAHRSSPDYGLRKGFIDAARELETVKSRLKAADVELEELGVTPLDPLQGVAAFPFRWSRNSRSRRVRKAYFLLKLQDDPDKGIHAWRFAGEVEERRIPPHWLGQLSSPILAEVGR